MFYTVFEGNRQLTAQEIIALYPSAYFNYHDLSFMSVQVGVEDDSSFNETMEAAGYSVQEYTQKHD